MSVFVLVKVIFHFFAAEKYLSLIGFGPERENVKHVKITGLRVESTSEEKR